MCRFSPLVGVRGGSVFHCPLNRITLHRIAVTIIPQMDETRPWLVEMELPVLGGTDAFYFTDVTLVGALKKALDEYSRRDAARTLLMERVSTGTRKED